MQTIDLLAAQTFNSTAVTLIVGTSGAIAVIVAAFIAYRGTRKTQESNQLALIIEALQADNTSLRSDRTELHKEVDEWRKREQDARADADKCRIEADTLRKYVLAEVKQSEKKTAAMLEKHARKDKPDGN